MEKTRSTPDEKFRLLSAFRGHGDIESPYGDIIAWRVGRPVGETVSRLERLADQGLLDRTGEEQVTYPFERYRLTGAGWQALVGYAATSVDERAGPGWCIHPSEVSSIVDYAGFSLGGKETQWLRARS